MDSVNRKQNNHTRNSASFCSNIKLILLPKEKYRVEKNPDKGLKVQNTLEKENGLWMVKKNPLHSWRTPLLCPAKELSDFEGPSD